MKKGTVSRLSCDLYTLGGSLFTYIMQHDICFNFLIILNSFMKELFHSVQMKNSDEPTAQSNGLKLSRNPGNIEILAS